MDIDPVSPKTKYNYKSQQIYINSHGSQQLQGSWKKKFVSELTAKSKSDRFQKLMRSRNINDSENSRESFRRLLEQEWELFRNQEGLSHFNKEEMADFLLSLQDELMNPDEDIIRMYEEQQEWEAQALLDQINQYQAEYDCEMNTANMDNNYRNYDEKNAYHTNNNNDFFSNFNTHCNHHNNMNNNNNNNNNNSFSNYTPFNTPSNNFNSFHGGNTERNDNSDFEMQ